MTPKHEFDVEVFNQKVDTYRPSKTVLERLGKTTLVGIVGPSGIGKNTVISCAGKIDARFKRVKSHTTKPGNDPYYYKTRPTTANLARLDEAVNNGRLVQIARHPSLPQYYWSNVDEWSAGFSMLDVLPAAFEQLADYNAFQGVLAVTLATEPEQWYRQFLDRNRCMKKSEIQGRLREAKSNIEWALSGETRVHWVINPPGQPQLAAKEIIKIATLEEVDKPWNHSATLSVIDQGMEARALGELMLESIRKRLPA